MKKYKAILLDLDATIFDFDKAEIYSLSKMLESIGIMPTEKIIYEYHDINIKWWEKYERKEYTKQEILVNRFEELFKKYQKEVDCVKFNEDYLYHLADVVFYIDNALEFLERLKKEYKIYIVTNGVTNTQLRRINQTPLMNYVEKVYISDTIGYAKPDIRYYEYILKDASLSKKECLCIGDSLTSDMLGGINAGIDTCWFNPSHKTTTLSITYEIDKLLDFFKVVK